MRLPNRRFVIIVVVVAAVTAVAAWKFNEYRTKAVAEKKTQESVTVRRETIRETLTISGHLEADEKTTLRFQTSGFLSWVGVKVGDRVSRYQAIASLDREELKKRLQKYLLSYQKNRWDFDQTKDEYQDPEQKYWGLSQEARSKIDRALDKSQFDLNSSVLDVEIQNIALNYATLTTPIAGLITKADSPFAGVNITPSQAEFEVINPASLYLSVLADQTEVIKLSQDMAADMTFDAYPDRTVHGTVTDISYTPKEGETGTVYEVKLSIPDKETTSYRLGMTADALFTTGEKKDALVIPSKFIKSENGKSYVTKGVGNAREKVFIQTGIESDSNVEVTSGLSEGDILYD